MMKFIMIMLMIILGMSNTTYEEQLIVWMMMEIMGFLMISMCTMEKKTIRSTPMIIIMQTLSSFLLMMAIIWPTNSKMTAEIMVVVAIMMKTGMFPFSYIMIQAFKEMNWTQCIMMMTIMKVPAMVLMSMTLNKEEWIMVYAASLSILILTPKMMPILPSKEILAISSGIQSSWMVGCIMVDYTMWWAYFFIYTAMTIFALSSMKEKWPEESLMESPEKSNNMEKTVFITITLSMMGVPPTILFIMKTKVLMTLVPALIIPASVMAISSSLSLLMYSRMLLTYMMINLPEVKKNAPLLKSQAMFMMLAMILLSLTNTM